MTGDKIDALLKALDRLTPLVDDGDAVREPQPTRIDAVLVSVIAALFAWPFTESSLAFWNK